MKPPCRICPGCGTGDEVRDGEAIWPATWSCGHCGRSIELCDGLPIFAPALADTMSGMDPALFEDLANWESDNFWFVPRNRLITGLLGRYFPDAGCLMEVGCGNGFVLAAIAHLKPWRHLVASELHPAGLTTARSRLGEQAEFVQMDARAIPARDVFDVIGAFDVLEHIEEDDAVLASMYRAVRCGGGILLAVPQHPWLWSNADEAAMHVRRYRRGELERKVSAAGFRLLFSASYTALLLPVMATSRWLGANKADALSREFELPRTANRLLRAIVQTEVTLTLAGIHFPAGGSRVVVAAKPD